VPGAIRYANYQSQQKVIDYLTANGFGPETYAGWFTAPSSASLIMQSKIDDAEANALGRVALRGGDAVLQGVIDPASLVFTAPALDDHLRAEFYG
jgi:serralysin